MKLPKKQIKDALPELRVLPQPEQTDEEQWLDSLENVVEHALAEQGLQKTAGFLGGLTARLRGRGLDVPRVVSTPYINTIPLDEQAPFPGNWEIERRIKSFMRWNAMAMVVKANHDHSGRRAHLDLRLVGDALRGGLQPFLPRRATDDFPGDMVYFQGHAAPGIMRGRFWKAGWTSGICKISARNWPRAAGCRRIRIRI